MITIVRHSQQTSHQIIDASLKKMLSKHNIDITLYDLIICSPYLRCRETEQKLNSTGLPISIDVRLSEFQYSDKPFKRISQLTETTLSFGNIPITNELWEDFINRVETVFSDIQNLNKNILVITHGLVVKHLYEYLSAHTQWNRGRDVPFIGGFTLFQNEIQLI